MIDISGPRNCRYRCHGNINLSREKLLSVICQILFMGPGNNKGTKTVKLLQQKDSEFLKFTFSQNLSDSKPKKLMLTGKRIVTYYFVLLESQYFMPFFTVSSLLPVWPQRMGVGIDSLCLTPSENKQKWFRVKHTEQSMANITRLKY